MAAETVIVRHDLIRDLVGALQEAQPHLEGGRSAEAKELGRDIRLLIKQAEREAAACVAVAENAQRAARGCKPDPRMEGKTNE